MNARTFVFSSQLADTVRLVAEGDGGVTFTDGSLVVTGAVGAAKSVVLDMPVQYVAGLRVRAGDPAADAHPGTGHHGHPVIQISHARPLSQRLTHS